jgi:hypothetical protein
MMLSLFEAGQRKRAIRSFNLVMPGLVPGIHVFLNHRQDVDGRDKPGHDVVDVA